MKPPDLAEKDMTGLGGMIVARAVKLGRHYTAKIGAVLAVVGLAQFNTGDVGDSVGFVARFERSDDIRIAGLGPLALDGRAHHAVVTLDKIPRVLGHQISLVARVAAVGALFGRFTAS